MGVAWLITLPCAGLVGALTSFIAVRGGVAGTILVIVMLIVGALAIIRQANQHRVDFSNVNDSNEVVVLKRNELEPGAEMGAQDMDAAATMAAPAEHSKESVA